MPPKQSASRQLYDAIQSGGLSFEEFKLRLLDEQTAQALLKVWAISAELDLRILWKLQSVVPTYTKFGSIVNFDILLQNSDQTYRSLGHMSVLKNRYALNSSPWTSKQKIKLQLREMTH